MKSVRTYDQNTHLLGKIWIWMAVFVIMMVPVAACVRYDAWPALSAVGAGLMGVAPIYWTVGFIEVVTYTPMLGTGGTFLAFVTGNLTSMKVPAALNAMESMKCKPGTEEGEVVSTIAVATSSIVTTLVILLGVLLLQPLTPILNNPALAPAFDNILPALFGGLAVVYIAQNWKLSVAPLAVMIALFLAVPGLASSVGILVPVGILISLGAARILYRKGWL